MHITKHRTMALVTIAQFVQSGSEIRSGKCVFDWVNPVGFISGDLWNRFNYLAEQQDKVDADINTMHQHIINLGQHQHVCDANFLGLRTTAMGLLNATRSDIFRLMDKVHTMGHEVQDLKEWAEWAEFDPTRDGKEQDNNTTDMPLDNSVDAFGNYGQLRRHDGQDFV